MKHRTRPRSLVLAVMAASLLAAGCGSDGEPESNRTGDTTAEADEPAATAAADGESATEPDADTVAGGEEVDEPAPRLVVTDAASGMVTIVDLATGEPLTAVEVTGPAVPTVAPDGRHVLLAQGDDDEVAVLDAGSWVVPHGDHVHAYVADPVLRGAMEVASPSHVVAHDDMVAVFSDGDGDVTLVPTDHLTADSIEGEVVDAGEPHHGVGIAIDDLVVATTADSTLAEGELPGTVTVFGADGEAGASFDDCAEIHGEATVGNGLAFACADGVMVLTGEPEALAAEFVAYGSGFPDEARAYSLHAADGADHLVTDVADPVTYESVAVGMIDPATGEVRSTPVPEPYAYAFGLTDDGKAVIADITGAVHLVDPVSGTIEVSVPGVVTPFAADDYANQPSVVVSGDRAYVTDPAGGEVVELATNDDLREARRLTVDGAPSSLVVVGDEPVTAGHDHDVEHDDEGE